jgi:hypothetical protein
MKSLKLLALVYFACSASFAFAEPLGSGDFQESEYYCAQVWACDDNGKIADEFNIPDDPCYQHYVLQCDNLRYQQRETACSSEIMNMQQTIEKLRKKIRELRRLQNG